MPSGVVKQHPTHGKMIQADDGKWVFLPDGATFELDTKVDWTEYAPPGVQPPPGIYRAATVEKAKPASPWTGTFKPSAAYENAAVTSALNAVKPPASRPAKAEPATPTRAINDSTALADYHEIKRALARMTWSGNFGPSVRVETKLKWENPAARELYLKLKEELHDQRIPGTGLYYYLTGLGISWGKAGFRITGHTRPSAKVENSKTEGVLHVENV